MLCRQCTSSLFHCSDREAGDKENKEENRNREGAGQRQRGRVSQGLCLLYTVSMDKRKAHPSSFLFENPIWLFFSPGTHWYHIRQLSATEPGTKTDTYARIFSGFKFCPTDFPATANTLYPQSYNTEYFQKTEYFVLQCRSVNFKAICWQSIECRCTDAVTYAISYKGDCKLN